MTNLAARKGESYQMESLSIEQAKQSIREEVRKLHPRLTEISHTIHDNPEIKFEERQASDLLTRELASHGFAVERSVAGLPTAFVATYGKGRPAIAFLAEYDALPGIGHGCGHNLVGTWATGAGIALRHALSDVKGTIKVIGTPGEEGGGGKVIMAEHGIFRGLDAAMLMHPRNGTLLDRGSLAITHYDIEFFGKAAHASSYPDRGISALDAILHVFFSVNALRQMLRPDARIHGCITHGGDAPNTIPEYAAAKFLVRSKDQAYLEELKQRFLKIVEGAGLATGARPQVTTGISYKARVSNQVLIEAMRQNMQALGVPYEDPPLQGEMGSSDMGDVSQIVPAILPYLQICDKGIAAHSRERAEAAASPRADEATLAACTLLAWTGADVLLRPDLSNSIRQSFRRQLGRDPQD